MLPKVPKSSVEVKAIMTHKNKNDFYFKDEKFSFMESMDNISICMTCHC